MKILSLDASASNGSIALVDASGECLSALTFPSGRQEGGEIFAKVESLAKEYGPTQRIVVGLGPGSYSGIRQAIALAQGLQLAWNCELAGLPSACGVSEATEYQVFGDARRGSYYHTHILDGLPVEGPQLIDAAGLAAKLASSIPSYTVEPLTEFPQIGLRLPSAVLLATIALLCWDRIRSHPVEPFYLREPNITVAKDAPRLPKNE